MWRDQFLWKMKNDEQRPENERKNVFKNKFLILTLVCKDSLGQQRNYCG